MNAGRLTTGERLSTLAVSVKFARGGVPVLRGRRVMQCWSCPSQPITRVHLRGISPSVLGRGRQLHLYYFAQTFFEHLSYSLAKFDSSLSAFQIRRWPSGVKPTQQRAANNDFSTFDALRSIWKGHRGHYSKVPYSSCSQVRASAANVNTGDGFGLVLRNHLVAISSPVRGSLCANALVLAITKGWRWRATLYFG